MGPKKGGALLAIELGPKPKAKEASGEVDMEAEDGEEVDMQAAKIAAAEAAIKAFKSGDAEALSAALEEHYACCQESE